MSSEPRLELRSLSASWDRTEVVHQVSLSVAPGEFVVLMGPNGGGKTTLLRTIAGFERASSGEVRLDGRTVTDLPAHRRGIGILFQEPALFPRRSVWSNVAYGLEVARRPSRFVADRVAAMSALLHLDDLLERPADSLSGGERQRVALARTLAPGPRVVLLDEPFAAVDPELRSGFRAEFRRALQELGVSAIHVTHDRDEGLFLGDRVLLLLGGRLVQSGPPQEVYRNPRSAEAARFLGYNLLQEKGRTLAIDPREVEVGPPGEGVRAEVDRIGPSTDGVTVLLRLPDRHRIEARLASTTAVPGSTVGVRWRRSVDVDEPKAPL